MFSMRIMRAKKIDSTWTSSIATFRTYFYRLWPLSRNLSSGFDVCAGLLCLPSPLCQKIRPTASSSPLKEKSQPISIGEITSTGNCRFSTRQSKNYYPLSSNSKTCQYSLLNLEKLHSIYNRPCSAHPNWRNNSF